MDSADVYFGQTLAAEAAFLISGLSSARLKTCPDTSKIDFRAFVGTSEDVP